MDKIVKLGKYFRHVFDLSHPQPLLISVIGTIDSQSPNSSLCFSLSGSIQASSLPLESPVG